MKSDFLALAAIVLWASLATLGVDLSQVPPFLLTGLGLLIGSAIALPSVRFRWAYVPAGLLGFAGADMAILGHSGGAFDGDFRVGYVSPWHRRSSGPAIR